MSGKPAAERLKADGFNVRLLARNPKKHKIYWVKAIKLSKAVWKTHTLVAKTMHTAMEHYIRIAPPKMKIVLISTQMLAVIRH